MFYPSLDVHYYRDVLKVPFTLSLSYLKLIFYILLKSFYIIVHLHLKLHYLIILLLNYPFYMRPLTYLIKLNLALIY